MKRLLLALVGALALTACNSQPPSTAQHPPEAAPGRSAELPRASGRDREAQRNRRAESNGSGAFDFYLLNLSWSPEFCATHPQKPECAQHLGFVLHGLWPQNIDGTYPEHCRDVPGPSNPTAFSDLYPDPGLLQHEWQTHGACSGLAPEAFFSLARRAVHALHIPRELSTLDHQESLPPAAILDLFHAANPGLPPDSLALGCGNNDLTAVELCLGKDLHPTSCRQVRSCRANSVRIPPPIQ